MESGTKPKKVLQPPLGGGSPWLHLSGSSPEVKGALFLPEATPRNHADACLLQQLEAEEHVWSLALSLGKGREECQEGAHQASGECGPATVDLQPEPSPSPPHLQQSTPALLRTRRHPFNCSPHPLPGFRKEEEIRGKGIACLSRPPLFSGLLVSMQDAGLGKCGSWAAHAPLEDGPEMVLSSCCCLIGG